MRRRNRPRPAPPASPGNAPHEFHVVVGPDGTAHIDGRRLPPSGVPAQTAVLDQLHRHAMAGRLTVEATVLDHRHRWALRLRVGPDGTSELLREPTTPTAPHTDTPAFGPPPPEFGPPTTPSFATPPPKTGIGATDTTAFGPPPPAPGPPTAFGGPPPEFGVSALRTVAAPAPGAGTSTEAPPEGTGSPADAPVPDSHTPIPDSHTTVLRRVTVPDDAPPPSPAAPVVPADLVRAVAHINEAVVAGDLPLAGTLVDRLKQHTVGTLGATHPHTLETYALEAYVAHLTGDQERATAVSLHLAGLRQRQGDPRAREDVLRAAATWNLVGDPRTAVRLGRELLAVWERTSARGGPESADTRARQQAESRLHSLARHAHPQGLAASA